MAKISTSEFLKSCFDDNGGFESTINALSHFPPVPEYSELLKLRAKDNFSNKKDLVIADLVESMGITTRHHGINLNRMSLFKQREKRARDQCSQSSADVSGDMFEDVCAEPLPEPSESQLSTFVFEKFDYMGWTRTLPKEWTILQISELPSMPHVFRTAAGMGETRDLPSLGIVRFACGPEKPSWNFPVVQINAPVEHKDSGTPGLVQGLRNLIAGNSTLTNDYRGNKEAYWKARLEHHHQLKSIINSLENRILGHWKCLFLGSLKDPSEAKNFEGLALNICAQLQCKGAILNPETRYLIRLHLSAYSYLTREQIIRGLATILGVSPKDPLCAEALKLVDRFAADLKSYKESKRNPVILILDKVIQEFPWESMSVLSTNPVSRLPSMHMLRSLVTRHCTLTSSKSKTQTEMKMNPYVDLKLRDPSVNVDPKSGFYVINPGCDLQGLQQRLLPIVRKLWGDHGFAGQSPEEMKLKEFLTDSDVFLYCGHGSGTKYLSEDRIVRLENPAAPIVMGCSSGRLAAYGKEMEPTGTVVSYLIAGSPCYVGMLWDVTDVDCDRLTLRFLDLWLGALKGELNEEVMENYKTMDMPPPVEQFEPEMLRAVAESRKATKLVLTGGAAVVYGLPARAIVEQEPRKT